LGLSREEIVRKLGLALLIIVCLAVIVIPAVVVVPQVPARPPFPSTRAPVPRAPFGDVWLFERWSPFGAHMSGWPGIVSALASWVYLYVTAALLIVLLPRRVRCITAKLRAGDGRERLRLFLIGLLAALVSGLLIVLARYAFVWGALVIMLSAAVMLLSFLGILSISLMVGEIVLRWANLKLMLWFELALGSLVVFALGRIPVAGWIGIGVVAAWGLGAVLATHLGSGEAWSLRDWQAIE
jgi:hypothetical protein